MSTPELLSDAECCPCPQPEHLGELVQRQGWGKALQVLDHMDSCSSWLEELLYEKVGDPQWDWVFCWSLQDPTHQTTGLLKELIRNNQCSALLDVFPAGPVQNSLTKLLLMASIRHGLGDLALHLTQRESISDLDLMDAIEFAVHLLSKTIFLQLVRDCPRSRRVIKQQFAYQHWNRPKLGEEKVDWIYETLYQGGHKDLALLVSVAVINQYGTYLVIEFCFDETCRFDSAWNENRYVLRKMHSNKYMKKYRELVKELYEQFLDVSETPVFSAIFRKAVEKAVDFDCIDSFVRLRANRHYFCEYSFSMKKVKEEDLYFAYSYAEKRRPHFISAVCKEIADEDCPTVLNESQILFDVVVDNKDWDLLPVLLSTLRHERASDDEPRGFFKLLEMVVHKMLSDQSIWPFVALILDKAITEQAVGFQIEKVLIAKETLEEKTWPFSVSSLKQWCVDNGHGYLALFLALVTQDWKMVKTVVGTKLSALDLHPTTLLTAVEMIVDINNKLSFPAGVAMLKKSPLTTRILDSLKDTRRFTKWINFADLHLNYFLVEWPLIIQVYNWNYSAIGDFSTFLRNLRCCQNSALVNFILKKAFSDCYSGRFAIARELMTKCTDPEVLKSVLREAVTTGNDDIAKALIGRVDPVTCVGEGNKTLLFFAVSSDCSAESETKMIRFCVAAGLSPFQRDVPMDEHNCPLLKALESERDDVIKLLLASGAYSHKSLESTMRFYLRSAGVSAALSTGYGKVCQAAAAPFRLDHMARTVVSRRIGCHPGRSDRIESLEIAEYQKDPLYYKDVLEREREEQDEHAGCGEQ